MNEPEISLTKEVAGTDHHHAVPVVAAVPVDVETATTTKHHHRDHRDHHHARTAKSANAPAAVPSSTAAQQQKQQQQIIRARAELRQQGFPDGLIDELWNHTITTYPIRYWVVDNSGSMLKSDGHELRPMVENNNNHDHPATYMAVECTRWKELQSTVEYHIELAHLLQAKTIFRFLNDPNNVEGVGGGVAATTTCPQEFMIGGGNNNNDNDDEDMVTDGLDWIRQIEPLGVTPLTEQINNIYGRISDLAPELKRHGQKAVVVIATDGMPSDPDGKSTSNIKYQFKLALQKLQRLPVWIVIRLCTDEEKVVDYYNDLDRDMEWPLEVMDDYLGEAQEIAVHNKWLNYTLPLHRCREMGYQHRIFDLLDERTLNKDELYEYLCLIFGPAVLIDAPNIHSDWKGFANHVKTHIVKNNDGRYEWNPRTQTMGPWIDMKQLHKTYGDKKKGLFMGLFGAGKGGGSGHRARAHTK